MTESVILAIVTGTVTVALALISAWRPSGAGMLKKLDARLLDEVNDLNRAVHTRD